MNKYINKIVTTRLELTPVDITSYALACLPCAFVLIQSLSIAYYAAPKNLSSAKHDNTPLIQKKKDDKRKEKKNRQRERSPLAHENI